MRPMATRIDPNDGLTPFERRVRSLPSAWERLQYRLARRRDEMGAAYQLRNYNDTVREVRV